MTSTTGRGGPYLLRPVYESEPPLTSPSQSAVTLYDAATGPGRWRFVSDTVMGGVSRGALALETIAGRPAIHLTGSVSTANSGGFVQAALPLTDPDGRCLDGSGADTLELTVFGNGESYNVHLRTPDVVRPWQSYRASFVAGARWQQCELPLGGFEPHRIDVPFDLSRICRLGVVAIGREFEADVAIARIRLVGADA